MKIPDVHARRLTENDAVRVDDIDVISPRNISIDYRAVSAAHNVQIVVGLRPAVILDNFSTPNGVIRPTDDIVCIG